MSIKIDREVAGNIKNPSLELIAWCITQHQKQLDRLEKLSDYYDGKHEIVNRNKTTDSPLSNVVVNNAKYITDMNVGFTVGNPVAYSAQKDEDIQQLLDLFDKIKVNRHDRELEKDFLDTDNTVDSNKLFAVSYLKKSSLKGEDGWQVEVYTKEYKLIYRVKDLDMTSAVLKDVKEHYYDEVPVVEFRNNEEKQGDFEQALSLIDAYNILQSDRLNDKEAFIDAILVLYGFSLSKEVLEDDSQEKETIKGNEGNNGNMIEAPPKSEGTAVEWLTKTFDETQVDILAKSIQDNIHKVTYTPNLSDEHFAGNISGRLCPILLEIA